MPELVHRLLTTPPVEVRALFAGAPPATGQYRARHPHASGFPCLGIHAHHVSGNDVLLFSAGEDCRV
jgi:hypothetical protein